MFSLNGKLINSLNVAMKFPSSVTVTEDSKVLGFYIDMLSVFSTEM